MLTEDICRLEFNSLLAKALSEISVASFTYSLVLGRLIFAKICWFSWIVFWPKLFLLSADRIPFFSERFWFLLSRSGEFSSPILFFWREEFWSIDELYSFELLVAPMFPT